MYRSSIQGQSWHPHSFPSCNTCINKILLIVFKFPRSLVNSLYLSVQLLARVKLGKLVTTDVYMSSHFWVKLAFASVSFLTCAGASPCREGEREREKREGGTHWSSCTWYRQASLLSKTRTVLASFRYRCLFFLAVKSHFKGSTAASPLLPLEDLKGANGKCSSFLQ